MPFRRRASALPPDPLAAVDPAAVPATYRPSVSDALAARARFAALVSSVRPGPLRDRLQELSTKVDAGVLAVTRSVEHAVELERVVDTLDAERVTAELKQARRSGADPEVVEALTARFASTNRLLDALDALRQRLPVLEARLGTAVARAAELVLTSSAAAAPAELDALAGELDTLTVDLQALGAATREVG